MMKVLYTSLCMLLIGALSHTAQAQIAGSSIPYGAYQLPQHDESQPCITEEQYSIIEKRCATNLHALGLDHAGAQRSAAVALNWPLRMANGLNDNSYYIISAYVDQDATSGIKDWNCGTNTYNSHRGTDICTYPYPFYKMDNNMVEVVSAADGIIIDKHDGEFDKNCVSNSSQANYVVIQHADGTFANYFHMKKSSITSKAVGQTVTAGEYLGVVGSSGNANGPHLHFEVRTANSSATYKDPFAGGCNTLNGTSWWAAQKPYTEPAILKAQIGIEDPILAACPNTETPNELPCLAPDTLARLYIFIRDETAGMRADMSIATPSGRQTWTQTSTADHLVSIYGWARTMPHTPGTYNFTTTYNGITTNTPFEISNACPALVTTAVATVSAQKELQVYPNPTSGKLTISGEGLDNGDHTIMVRNMLGQTVLSDVASIDNNSIQKTVSISALPDGLYFLSLESKGSTIVRKIEKKN